MLPARAQLVEVVVGAVERDERAHQGGLIGGRAALPATRCRMVQAVPPRDTPARSSCGIGGIGELRQLLGQQPHTHGRLALPVGTAAAASFRRLRQLVMHMNGIRQPRPCFLSREFRRVGHGSPALPAFADRRVGRESLTRGVGGKALDCRCNGTQPLPRIQSAQGWSGVERRNAFVVVSGAKA